jgi:inner membrane protein
MDTLTQVALGAGVGVAVLGRRIAPRKAALVGGVLGIVPDLDVLVAFDDPIDAFVLHRGASHSLIVQAVVTPLFGEALMRLFKDLGQRRMATYLAVYLVFATHALLDALTVYGTRLLWPVWTEAVGTGSVFIIDPVYTVPLLVALIWALCLRSWTPRFRTVLTACLAVSTAYLAWGLVAQQIVYGRAARVLGDPGDGPERMLATPTPFNTLYWKVIAVDGERYINLYLPVFGSAGSVDAYVHPRGAGLAGCLVGLEALDKLARFSDGFYRIDLHEGEFVVSDLRMGLTPNYVFRFAIAKQTEDGVRPIPSEHHNGGGGAPGDLEWLFANLSGEFALRPAEAGAAVEDVRLSTLAGSPENRVSC